MELSQYVLEVLRRDEEFVLYRGEALEPALFTISSPASSSVYAVGLGDFEKVRERILVEGRTRLRLGSQPLKLSEQRGQTPLLLEDAGGETLVRFLPGPMEMLQFLRFVVGLATALGGLHKRELIHKDVKPSNVLVDPATGQPHGLRIGSRQTDC